MAEAEDSKTARAASKALVKTLNSDSRKTAPPKTKAKKPKVKESPDSVMARAEAAALVKTLNSDDRNRHAKNRISK